MRKLIWMILIVIVLFSSISKIAIAGTTCATATSKSIGTEFTTKLLTPGESQWYSFSPADLGQLYTTMSLLAGQPAGNYDLQLYSSCGGSVIDFSSYLDGAERMWTRVSGGIYYLRVFSPVNNYNSLLNVETSFNKCDNDGDGYENYDYFACEVGSEDCNDNNAAIKPGAAEVCDGVDNNCNGQTDESVCPTITYYCDSDSDAYISSSVTGTCNTYNCLPAGCTQTQGNDCNDADNSINPGAAEILCDNIDQDCSGSDASGTDTDSDGYKIEGGLCGDVDCNDGDNSINPGAAEVCDGIDNNCDGQTDENNVCPTIWYYCDADSDAYISSSVTGTCNTYNCLPGGCTETAGNDCNDADNSINPGAVEILCDNIDQDCSGSDDAGTDSDLDGYKIEGDLCGDIDCNDGDNSINPGAAEVCDGIDNNCDGQTDENNVCPEITYYCDNDSDSYISSSVTGTCNTYNCLPGGCTETTGNDCNDADNSINPGAAEILCDSTDQDCSGSDNTGTDADSDGYKIEGGLCGDIDCNDGDNSINPGAAEVCDGIDNNCNGQTDESVCPTITYYCDSDSDAYISSSVTGTCNTYNCLPGGCTETAGNDCNDGDNSINPGAAEILCDNIDQDCSGSDANGTDADSDGYKIEGGLCGDIDCNDNNASINPSAAEILCDNIDQDCSGSDANGTDADSDGYKIEGGLCGDIDCNDNNNSIYPGAAEILCDNIDQDCSGSDANGTDADSDGYKIEGGLCGDIDCNDNNNSINPGAAETCDGIDNNCNSQTDENPSADLSCSDSIGCTNDICSSGSCQNNANNSYCDDGLWCNGQETCDSVNGCLAGNNVDCSGNNMSEINTCTNNPDNNPFTLDYGAGFISTCNEVNDQCTTGTPTLASTCDKTNCSAECETNSDCPDTNCDVLDGCIGYNYYDYTDVNNSCNGCSCTDNTCSSPLITAYDPRCTECQADSDCSSLENNYCDGNMIKKKDYYCLGICVLNNTITIDNCNDGIYCNGVETCSNAVCISGSAVDCSGNNLAEINTCTNNPDGNAFTWDHAAGFASQCDETNDKCTTGSYSYNHSCSISGCSADCETSNDCTDTECDGLDKCYSGTYKDYSDVSNICSGCSCSSNQCSVYNAVITDADNDGYDIECDNDKSDNDNTIYPGAVELCDAKDNDQDGNIDENFNVNTSCSAGVGECANTGIYVCRSDKTGTECNAVAKLPSGEICDNKDNDCDGSVDENNVCPTCVDSIQNGNETGIDCGGSCPACDKDKDGYDYSIDCNDNNVSKWQNITGYLDGDNDGYGTGAAIEICSGYSISAGYALISGDCDDNNLGIKPNAEELCDGKDNDCDSLIDEGFSLGSSCTVGIGECKKTGQYVCKADKTGAECNAVAGSPIIEVCDNKDNNCDGSVDEELTKQYGTNIGACEYGIKTCEKGSWIITIPSIEPTDEACDNVDNDCDSSIDETLERNTTCGLGACSGNKGKEVCIAGNWQGNTCNPYLGAVSEACDSMDNDCDGSIDEELTKQYGTNVGVCEYSIETCENGNWELITDGIDPIDEVCDSLDNNCDGSIDEDLIRNTVCGTGQCSGNTGQEECISGSWQGNTCNAYSGATTEICDNLDNDCDGSVDQTFNSDQCNFVCQDDDYTWTNNGGSLNCCGNGLKEGEPYQVTESSCSDGKDNDCDGKIDALDSNCAATCSDGIKDGDETGVDCGGPCPGCPSGRACSSNSDCESKYCSPDNRCSAPRCYDGWKNGDETDVDCGGSCLNKCAINKKCTANSDCGTQFCKNNICTTDCNDGIKNGLEEGVDCGYVCGNSCGICQPIINNGDSENKIDVIFITSAFDLANLQIDTTVKDFVDYEGTNHGLMSYEPFKSNREKFNFWIVDKFTGFSDLEIDNENNTFEIAKIAHDYCPHEDQIVLLAVNQFRSFASTNRKDIGLGNAYVSICEYSETCDHIYSDYKNINKAVLVHEFGHSFGGLADEYDSGKNSGLLFTKTSYRPNCDSSSSCSKWKPAIESAGCVPVCGYRDWYKPYYNTIMRNHKIFGDGYRDVNIRELQKDIDEHPDIRKPKMKPDNSYNLSYLFDIEYNQGKLSLLDVKLVSGKASESDYYPEGEHNLKLISFDNDILKDQNFDFSLFYSQQPSPEWFDENGTQISFPDEPSIVELDHIKQSFVLNYHPQAKSIEIYQEWGLKLSIDVSEYHDLDDDKIIAVLDNCPMDPNPGQEDDNNNGKGDACESLTGDINKDERVDRDDVEIAINQALGISSPTPEADVNNDNIVDILDVQKIVQLSLTNKIDANYIESVITQALGLAEKNDEADINGDGEVDIFDVQAMINIIFSEQKVSRCNEDDECGEDTFLESPYCKKGIVYQKYGDYECINSACTYSEEPKLKYRCYSNEKCENGECVKLQQPAAASTESQQIPPEETAANKIETIQNEASEETSSNNQPTTPPALKKLYCSKSYSFEENVVNCDKVCGDDEVMVCTKTTRNYKGKTIHKGVCIRQWETECSIEPGCGEGKVVAEVNC